MDGMQKNAILVLESGKTFKGKSFGYPKKAIGEICFNTSMTGYQEIITDPSYRQQIITFSYPMIGNYGIRHSESQSRQVQAAGLIVKEYVPRPSHFASEQSLGEFLQEHQIPALEAIDTRLLVLTIRNEGAQNAGIFIGDTFEDWMLDEVRSAPSMEGYDIVDEVSVSKAYCFGQTKGKAFRLAVLDFGIKTSILELLDQSGFAVKVFPAKTTFAELQTENFDCYFLSNGPGDPGALDYAIAVVAKILEEGKPTFGICLGHQLIGLASGYSRYKLKFGHRGANQPVRNENSQTIEITSQNHGFAIEENSSIKNGIQIAYKHLNDHTISGFQDKKRPLMCVQYHPEASPGPHDSRYLFEAFFKMAAKYYDKN